MSAFDTWVQNEDHKNHAGNLLVSLGTGLDPEPHVAYIDYAYSLSYAWKIRGWENAICIAVYDPAISPDLSAMSAAVKKIQKLREKAIHDVVGRIPEPFLSVADRDMIIEGLLYRRTALKQIMTEQYRELS